MTEPKHDLGRRRLLGAGGALAMAQMLGGTGAPARERSGSGPVSGRRKLRTLEVSAIGIGVQNMSRTFQTTTPARRKCTTSSGRLSIGV